MIDRVNKRGDYRLFKQTRKRGGAIRAGHFLKREFESVAVFGNVKV